MGAVRWAAVADPLLGAMVGPYRVESVLGRGGMGVVYRAVDERLGRTVALKLVASDLAANDTFVQRFLAEGRAAAAVEHPNVVPVYDVGEHEGRPWLAMRMVDGQNLAELLGAGPLEPRRALRLVGQVAAALDALHARGHVHRDVKPENVLVASGDHVMLSDFGLSRAVQGARLTQAGGFAASPAYASPEQLQGAGVGPSGDVYALAGVLFTCLTAQEPFPRPDVLAVLMAHASAPPPRVTDRVPELPPAVDDVIARGMAKAPAERFASCGELVEAAETALLHSASAPTLVGHVPTLVDAARAFAPPPPQSSTLIVPGAPPAPWARADAPPAAARSRWRPWHGLVAVVVVVGLLGAGAIVAMAGRDSGGGFDPDDLSGTPPEVGIDHWHVAYGVYICDRWLDPVLDQTDPEGIHSHADGIIHVHPTSGTASGPNARFDKLVEAIGATVDETSFTWPSSGGPTTETHGNGERCGDKPAKVISYYDGSERYDRAGTIRLFDRGKLVLALVPEDTPYEAIGDPPSTPGLDDLDDLAPPQTTP